MGAVVDHDYKVEDIAAILAPFAGPKTYTGSKPGATVHGFNKNLGGGIGDAFSFEDFRDATKFLVGKGWFGKGKYENIRDYGFACNWVEVEHPERAVETRALYFEVVDETERDAEINQRRYATSLDGTRRRIKQGEQVLRPASIFKAAQELGWRAPKPDPGEPASDLPPGFFRSANGSIWTKREKDGESFNIMVTPYPARDAWLTDQPPTLNFTTTIGGRDRIVHVKMASTGRKTDLASVVAGQGIVVRAAQTGELLEFIVAWITHLQSQRRTSYASPYGWTDGGFAFGGNVHSPSGLSPTGNPDEVLERQYTPCGDLDVWRHAACIITDQQRPSLDAILASAFAAPLVRFTGLDGLLACATSAESAVGKTTAQKVAQAVWGDPVTAAMILSDTENAAVAKMGAIKSLPVYWDEIKSEEQAQKFVDLAFQLSLGREKSRLSQGAEIRKSNSWQTMLLVCSNDSIVESIASQSKMSAAGVYRAFEWDVPRSASTPLTSTFVSTEVSEARAAPRAGRPRLRQLPRQQREAPYNRSQAAQRDHHPRDQGDARGALLDRHDDGSPERRAARQRAQPDDDRRPCADDLPARRA